MSVKRSGIQKFNRISKSNCTPNLFFLISLFNGVEINEPKTSLLTLSGLIGHLMFLNPTKQNKTYSCFK